MAKHALLSASGAHRWLECTPSALLELQFPQSTSEYAEEGTAAHELCELTARYFLGEVSEMDFENRHDELAKGPYYNAEMQECANDYARFVTEKTKAAQESCEDAFTELEVRVDFSKYVKDGFGTGDCIIVADKVLEIVDFKYGKGVRVEATGNPQMKLYALGALLKYNTLFDIDSVRMTIFQPRLSGVQSSDEITVKELLEWAEKYVKPRAISEAVNETAEPEVNHDEPMKMSDVVTKLESLFDILNRVYFDNALPKPVITVQSTPKAYGHCSTKKIWKGENDGQYEINIGAEFLNRPSANTAATMCHEMVHLYCLVNEIQDTCQKGRYHNKTFKAEAEARDLEIGYDRTVGFSHTNPTESFKKTLEDNGFVLEVPFARVMPEEKAKAEREKPHRYVCPVCGQEVKTTADLSLICGICEVAMERAD